MWTGRWAQGGFAVGRRQHAAVTESPWAVLASTYEPCDGVANSERARHLDVGGPWRGGTPVPCGEERCHRFIRGVGGPEPEVAKRHWAPILPFGVGPGRGAECDAGIGHPGMDVQLAEFGELSETSVQRHVREHASGHDDAGLARRR